MEEFPDIHSQMVSTGHELVNHTFTHPDNPHWAPSRYFNQLSSAEQFDEIVKCHEVVHHVTGFSMRGFRSPHFGNLHTDNVYPILKSLGYVYSSSVSLQYSRSKGEPYVYKDGIWEIPVGGSLNFPLAVFDNWNTLRKENHFFSSDDQFLEEFDSQWCNSKRAVVI